MANNTITKRFLSALDEILRITCMSLILYPVTYILPRKLNLWIANIVSILLVISPKSGRSTYFQMRRGFGKGRLESLGLTYRWLRQPFRDFVILTRVINNREDPATWRIIEKNSETIKELRESGDPYIVASGHFLREAILSMFDPRITYGHPIHVAVDVPEQIRSLYELRIRIQFGALLKSANFLEKKLELVFVGKCSFREILSRLNNQGNVLFLHVDAPWSANRPGSFLRPFAGHQSCAFATGAARLARLANCPVVSCIYMIENDGTVVIDWGNPIFPRKDDDDIEITNKLLNEIEIAIGKRPTQYILNIGGDRRWNPGKNCWENSSIDHFEN
jgi:lauroyl/myristoyl acyltransferase